MEAALLLCDYAEAVNGKLYMMGAGWNVLFAVDQPVNVSVATLIEVAWDQTNVRHTLAVRLLTLDGEPVDVDGHAVEATGEFEVGRPAGVKPGSSFNAPFVWNFAGVRLASGQYEWQLAIDGNPVARRAFTVAAAPAPA